MLAGTTRVDGVSHAVKCDDQRDSLALVNRESIPIPHLYNVIDGRDLRDTAQDARWRVASKLHCVLPCGGSVWHSHIMRHTIGNVKPLD